MALPSALVIFRLLPAGFSNRDLRQHLAALLGLPAGTMTAGRMTYDLRPTTYADSAPHGLIERIPGTHRYQLTDLGLRAAFFFTRAHHRLLRPGLAAALDPWPDDTPLHRHLDKLDSAITQLIHNAKLAA